MKPPENSSTWLGLSELPLPEGEASRWVTEPHIGAVVTFSGVARNHSEGRENVTLLEYEAYEDQVVPRMERIVEEARSKWATIGRVALLHRIGPVDIGEAAVVVAVIAEGTQITTLGRLNRLTPTRCSKRRIILCVTSKSVIAPCLKGRTAIMWPGVLPIICHASSPIASTSFDFSFRAITDGSFRTIPLPRA